MPNTPPTLTGFAASLNVVSTNGPTLLDADVVFSDADDSFAGGRLQITGLLGGDVAAVRHQGSGAGQIGFNAGTGEVSYGGVVIGVVTTGPARSFNIAFNASTTTVAVDALIQNLTFDTDQDTPTGSRTLRLGVFDHAGAVVNGPSTPSFTGLLFDLSVGSHADPGFVDLDADGWVDAVIGDGNGFITVLDGAGGAFSSTGLDNPFIGIDFGTRVSPSFSDLDNDGDVDAVFGAGDGLLRTFENQGGGVFSELAGGLNPFSGIDVGTISSPEFADIDGDGDKDLIIGAGDGTLQLYRRTGSNYALAGGDSPFLGFDIGADTSPSFGDIDGDGDADMILGSDDGTIRTYANTGSGFSLLGGAANPFNGYDNGFYSKTSLADLDGDGDLDLVIGDSYGNLDRYRNNEPRPSITVNVTFNDSPALSGLRSSAVFTENQVAATPQVLDTQVRLTDADGAFNGGSLSVSGLVSGDIVSVRHQGSAAGQIGISSGTVSYGGTAIGTASGGTGGTALTISFNSSASTAAVDALIQNLTYANLSDAPIADRTLTITATDAYGGANAASPPRFVQADSNPFQIGFTGPASRASFGDVDLDGDLDVAIGQGDGTIVYFRNTGGPTNPVYDWPFGFNPFYGLDFGDNSAPALADLDGDGDVDGLVTNSTGTVRYFRNDGAQQWVERTGANDPFNGVNVGYYVAPTIADVDGDGRKDVVVGNFDGDLRYFRNTGSVSSPAFTEQTGASSPFDGIDIGAGSAPAFGDLDGDGDLDLFVGKGDGEIAYYRNTGSTAQPVYVLQSGAANPFDGVNVGDYAAPSLADLDSDGDVDAFVGPGGYGSFYFINTAQQDSIAVHVTAVNDAPTLSGVATTVTFSENDVAGAGQVLDADVTFADPDSDGGVLRVGGLLAEDRVSVRNEGTGAGQIGFNSGTGQVTYGGNLIGLASGGDGASLVVTLNAAATPAAMDALIQNLTYANVSGAPTASRTLTLNVTDAGGAPANGPFTPSFTHQTGGANPFAAIDVSRSDPAFTDFDGDGLQDLVLGQGTGNLLAYRNTGSGFTQVTGAANPFDAIVIDAPYGASYGSPTFADVDGDGDEDLVLGYADGGLRAFEKTGSGYVELTGGANPFAAIATGYASRPSFGDFDGDGNLDLILNGYSHVTLAYRNTGSGYVQITNPFQGAYTSMFSFAFADIDGDGDMDAVAASTYGDDLLTFRNDAGTFVQLSGGANPFGGVAVYDGTVTFGDVDGDGDLDLVSGNPAGTLQYFRNNQPPAASITVEVIETNSPPTGTDASVTLLEDGAHVFIAANFGYGDSEGDAFLAVKITTLPGAGALKLNGADVTAGQVVSIADINSGLLVFTPAANANGAGYASFTFQVQDDGGTALGGVDLDPSPNTITLNVTPVNDAPSGANKTVVLLEDGRHTFATSEFGLTDPIDGHSLLAVVISTLPPAGSLKLNGVAVTAGQAVSAADIAAGLLVYSPAANGNGMAYGTFTFQVRDNGGTANGGLDTDAVPNFMHVNVTAVNDAPMLTGLGPSVTFNENTVNAAPQVLDTAVEFTDPEGNFSGGTLTLTGLLAQDIVSIRDEGSAAGEIGFSGGTVSYGGVAIGTASGGSGATLTVTFNASATSAAVDALIQNLTYANVSEAPTAGRTLRIEVTDAAGASTLSASPAFTERTGGANPFNGVDVGYKSVPTFADLDGDGDLDAIVGANSLTRYYLNTGSATSPSFVEQTGGANPFAALNGTTPGPRQRPSLADLDGDGDLDLLVGVLSGAFAYYQNTGSASAPAFTLQTGAANPMNGVSIPFRPTPSFVDLDGDGDTDLMIGDGGGVTRYYRNDGSPAEPNFVLDSSPLGGDVGFESVPRFADIDRDGDLDAFVSAHDGSIHFYRNTGTATSPVFAEETGAANPFNGLGFGSYAAVGLADLDGDGLVDAVVGTDAGTLRFFENTTSAGVPIVVNVAAQNDAPAGAEATITINEDAARVMAAADFGFSDVDGNSLHAVKITSLPTAGVLKLNNVDVTIGQVVSAADITAGLLIFTAAAHANGAGYASLTFQVQDNGGTSNGGVDLDPSANTLTFNVTAVNDAPSGADKTVSVAEDDSYVLVAADFGFGDTADGHSLTAVRITTLPGAGTLTLDGSTVTAGQFVSAADIASGLLVFAAAANANGNGYASFTFQVQDNGGTANSGVDLDPSANTITVNVTPTNDAPAGADKTVTASEDTEYVFASADFGFSDPLDGDAFAGVQITTTPSVGVLSLDGTAVSVDQFITVADITGGLLTYFAGANANGAGFAAFTFKVSDGAALDPTANTITIDVTALNDAPSGADKTIAINEDTPIALAVADFGFSDPVEGDELMAVTITTLPGAGTLTLDGDAVVAGQSVSAADMAAGLLVFTPATNANGAGHASFTFQVQDDGGIANSGEDLDPFANTITFDVAAVNDAPSGADKTVAVLEDAFFTFAAADFGFTDAEDGHALAAVKIASVPSPGALTLSGTAVTAGQSVSVADIAGGLLVFTPAANANGAGYASFTFQVQDNGGTANSGVDLDPSANTITVNVTAVNDAPSGADSTVTTNEDVAYIFAVADFGFSDSVDGNALQAVRIATLPAAGSLKLSGVAVNAGDVITVADLAAGKLRFSPSSNANGAGYADFTFQVRDNGGTANGGANLDPTANTLTVNVTPVNDAPTLTGWGPSRTVAENASPQVLDGNVVFNDVEANLDGGTLTVSSLLAEDIVAVRNQGTAAGQIGFNAGTGAVTYGGTLIGTATGGDGDDFVVTLNAAATVAAVDALIENLTYENESDAPTLSRTLRLTVVDTALGAVANLPMTVNITAANDAPAITAPGAYAADVGVKTALTGINFTDADAGNADVTATLQVASGTLAANASGGVDVTGTGTGTLILVGTIAQLNAFIAAEKVSFTSDGTATDPVLTLTIDDGGASGGGGLADQALITISVADHRKGTTGKDVLIGQGEDSHLEGLGGNDTLSGGDGNDSLQGGNGADVLNGGTGNDTLEGGAGGDTASYEGAAAGVTVSLVIAGLQNTVGAGQDSLLEIEALLGSALADHLTGDGLANTLTGGLGADTVLGGDGDDRLVGGDGMDVLQGGAGLDVLYGNADADVMSGGADADRFVFQAQSDSRKSDPDRITDLASGDLIDLRAVDANANKDGDQAFQLVGAFTNKAGQAMLSYNGTLDQTSLLLDVNGDSKSDMTIVLDGNHMGFTGFVL